MKIMNNKQLIQKILAINKELYKKAKKPLQCHGPEHHLRVCKKALELIKTEKLNVDVEVLIAACLLHDLSAYYPSKIGQEEHHEASCRIAKKELKKISYDDRKIDLILKAIIRHGTEHRPKDGKEMVEAAVLRDADKTESLGVIGVARIITAETRRDRSIDFIVDKWLSRIDKKYDSLTFESSKKKLKKEYLYAKEYFKQLKNYLNEK